MTRVLVIYEQIDNTVEVNLAAIETIFNVDGFVIRYRRSCSVTELDLNWCNMCYAIRPSSLFSASISQTLRESGRLFVSLFDDDLLHLPKSHSSYWRLDYMMTCLSMSKAVVMCNPLLIEDYKKIEPKPRYILNQAFVPECEIKKPALNTKPIKIIYAAGKDHTHLFETYIMPSLVELMEKHESLEMHIMGIEPGLDNFAHKDKIIKHPARSLSEYKEFMAEHEFSIGIAPLMNDSFSNRKYFIKYLDYARYGIAGIYSNYMPYTLVVNNNDNGLLVGDSVEEWGRALNNLVEDHALREKIINNSQVHIRVKFSVESVRSQFLAELEPLLCFNTPPKEVTYRLNPISVFKYKQKSNFHRLQAHLATDGFVNTFKKIMKK